MYLLERAPPQRALKTNQKKGVKKIVGTKKVAKKTVKKAVKKTAKKATKKKK